MKLIKEEDKDPKTLVKEYKRLEIFITIFMAIALCLGTFYFNVICFGAGCESKSPKPLITINPSKSSNDNEKVANEEKLSEWMSYVLKQDNVNANIARTRIAMNDGDKEINKTISLSSEELKEVFVKLSSYQVIKKYSLGMGYVDGDILKVTYTKNNNTYTLSISNNYIPKSDDGDLNNLIEKNIKSIENEELKNEDGSFYVYTFDVGTNYELINKIYDKYFN